MLTSPKANSSILCQATSSSERSTWHLLFKNPVRELDLRNILFVKKDLKKPLANFAFASFYRTLSSCSQVNPEDRHRSDRTRSARNGPEAKKKKALSIWRLPPVNIFRRMFFSPRHTRVVTEIHRYLSRATVFKWTFRTVRQVSCSHLWVHTNVLNYPFYM